VNTRRMLRYACAVFCLLLAAAAPLLVPAQEGGGRQLVVPLSSGGYVGFTIQTAPLGTQKISASQLDAPVGVTPQMLVDDDNVIHRVLVDREGGYVFGYDLVVEPLSASKQFKVSVRPLTTEFEERLRARQPASSRRAQQGLSISTLPHSTALQTIEDGDAFTLDLLINPQTGIKIVDLVKLSFDRTRLWQPPPVNSPPPRDFTLANVEMAVRDYKLLINGEAVAGGKPTRGCTGALVWFYIQDRGRFIFSLMPHDGFNLQKIEGAIQDNKISFDWKGEHYEWMSSSPIVGNGGNWNLWLLHDPDYNPDLFSPAQTTNSARARNDGINARLNSLNTTLHSMRDRERADFSPGSNTAGKGESNQSSKRRRVIVGGADRIENLLPKG
jgi:hypothetical protein